MLLVKMCRLYFSFLTDDFCHADVDECATGIAVCPRFRKCVNTFGSYICKCHEGFDLQYINGKYQCLGTGSCGFSPAVTECDHFIVNMTSIADEVYVEFTKTKHFIWLFLAVGLIWLSVVLRAVNVRTLKVENYKESFLLKKRYLYSTLHKIVLFSHICAIVGFQTVPDHTLMLITC